jgi:hypothetical protein
LSVTKAEDGRILLGGVCPIEEAETLLRYLSETPGATVDWSACEHAHTAVIQVLLAAQPRIVGRPADPFLDHHIAAWIGEA